MFFVCCARRTGLTTAPLVPETTRTRREGFLVEILDYLPNPGASLSGFNRLLSTANLVHGIFSHAFPNETTQLI